QDRVERMGPLRVQIVLLQLQRLLGAAPLQAGPDGARFRRREEPAPRQTQPTDRVPPVQPGSDTASPCHRSRVYDDTHPLQDTSRSAPVHVAIVQTIAVQGSPRAGVVNQVPPDPAWRPSRGPAAESARRAIP